MMQKFIMLILMHGLCNAAQHKQSITGLEFASLLNTIEWHDLTNNSFFKKNYMIGNLKNGNTILIKRLGSAPNECASTVGIKITVSSHNKTILSAEFHTIKEKMPFYSWLAHRSKNL